MSLDLGVFVVFTYERLMILYFWYMDTKEAIKSFRTAINEKVDFSIANIYLFGKSTRVESDVVALTKGGYFVEYEFKISRADFLVDKRKSKWRDYRMNYDKAPKYFFYVAPQGIIQEHEIPSFAGLIEITPTGMFQKIKKPLILNRIKPTDQEIKRVLKKFYFKDLNIYFDAIKMKKIKKYSTL